MVDGYKIKKHLFLILSFLALSSAFYGCNNKHEEVNTKALQAYIAINGTDTAWLNLDVTGTSFSGKCAINFSNKYTDSGDVKGRILGDTLLGDFRYFHYGLEWKRIAFALLKKDNKLIMGEGVQAEYLSIPYFKADRPIRFDKVKFVFHKVITAN